MNENRELRIENLEPRIKPAGRRFWVTIALTLIFLVGLGLHLWRISYPPIPVFDEAHFATYAVDYLIGQAHLEIHPPLGKLIYAAVLRGAWGSADIPGWQFLEVRPSADPGRLTFARTADSFGDFPYVPLRATAAVWGALLPLVIYWFARTVGAGQIGSLLSALFVMLDNAFLTDQRFIFLNGMFLVLGFAALAWYFRAQTLSYEVSHSVIPVSGSESNLPSPPPAPRLRRASLLGKGGGAELGSSALLAGILWGLALGVKITAVVFLGPILLFWAAGRQSGRRVLAFGLAGLTVLVILYALNQFFFSPQDQLNVWSTLGVLPDSALHIPARWHAIQNGIASAFVVLMELLVSVGGYVTPDGARHVLNSRWYEWLVGRGGFNLYQASTAPDSPRIALQGNLVLWYGALLAVLIALAAGLRNAIVRLHKEIDSRTMGIAICAPSSTRGQIGNLRPLRRSVSEASGNDKRGVPERYNRTLIILLGGYLASLAPFLVVTRSTFFYHYFPALCFAFVLLGWSIERLSATLSPGRRVWFIALTVLAVVTGFLLRIHLVYGVKPIWGS
ncbi:MAG: phospholipid carrier-dependent glycosyltransferase [Candidatus Liptonbacteria bacterium]|nr:phospholipid carrier-dependent glycosyltransferase [Candidatus Liptonbacteria bacterium]